MRNTQDGKLTAMMDTPLFRPGESIPFPNHTLGVWAARSMPNWDKLGGAYLVAPMDGLGYIWFTSRSLSTGAKSTMSPMVHGPWGNSPKQIFRMEPFDLGRG